MDINKILADLEAKHPGEKEYLQAVKEVLLSVQDVYNQHPESRTQQDYRTYGRTRPYLHLQSNMAR